LEEDDEEVEDKASQEAEELCQDTPPRKALSQT
jgi:hypothetical protein